MKDRLSAGTIAPEDAAARIQAWEAHAAFAQTRKLGNAVLGVRGADGVRAFIHCARASIADNRCVGGRHSLTRAEGASRAVKGDDMADDAKALGRAGGRGAFGFSWLGRVVDVVLPRFREDVLRRPMFGAATGWLIGLLLFFVAYLTFVYAPGAHIRADQAPADYVDGRIPVEWGWFTLGLISALALAIGLEPILGRSALGRWLGRMVSRRWLPGPLATLYRWSLGALAACVIHAPAFVLNVLDWLLVRVFSILAGTTLGGFVRAGWPRFFSPVFRYGAMAAWGGVIWAVTQHSASVLGEEHGAIAGLAAVILGIVLVFAIVRRWSWVERDREDFITAQGWDEARMRQARIGFAEDLRDEAMVAIVTLFLLFPLLLQHVDLVFDAFDPVDEDGKLIPDTAPTLWQWIGFFGVELTKSAPFVDWSEVFHAESGSRIEAKSGLGSIIAFLVRVFLDLLLLAAVIQALTLAGRLRAQKRAFLTGSLPILDPFEERRYFGDVGRELADMDLTLWRGASDTPTASLFQNYDYDQLKLLAAGAPPGTRVLSPALVDADARRGALAVMAKVHPANAETPGQILTAIDLNGAAESDRRRRMAALLGDLSGAVNGRALAALLQADTAPLDLKLQAARDAGFTRAVGAAETLHHLANDQDAAPALRAQAYLALAKLGDGRVTALTEAATRLARAASASPETADGREHINAVLLPVAYAGGRRGDPDALRAIADEAGLADRAYRSGAGELDVTIEIPTGAFLMGSPENEEGRMGWEGPQHEVTIAQAFGMSVYAVTFAEYDAFCAATGVDQPADEGWGRDRRPVINVSWKDAVAYVTWLNSWTGERYRLPSEAEWEYACRAQRSVEEPQTRYWFGDDEAALGDHAWFFGNAGGQTHRVGEKPANPFGLYDMHGNVWEWCADRWHGSYDGVDRPDDGRAWLSGGGTARVLRGGSWNSDPQGLRSAIRLYWYPEIRISYRGFRLARTILR